MRTRLVLASAAMGAALLTGGTVATAQAAPAAVASSWIYVGTYSTHKACYNDGVNSAYADWECRQSSSGKWQLWVDDAS
ncbi:hypothetical protein QC334_30770 [Streptomyces sp. DH18]|uniref:hypothetical protein n=1 Tax=Streptomyces TaxID=1883 RepID=UPI0024434ACD|nr:hypothetical protein [Streptomyces sp. DH18]MDG9687062.1 hypothetical protein [Streptomyces sp. DH18]